VTWFRVDDNLAHHAKTLAAGNAAMGLWVRAGSWAAHHLTGGVIPDAVIPSLGTRQQANALVAAGLWARQEDCFVFWEWDERNPTPQEVAEARAAKFKKKSEAGKLGGIASGVARRNNAKQTRSKREAGASFETKQNGSKTKPLPHPTQAQPASACVSLQREVEVDVTTYVAGAFLRAVE
jgi:hypothetical protein